MSAFKNAAAGIAILAVSSVAAVAAPIAANSVVGWTGTYQAQTSTGAATTLDLATQIDFSPAGAGGTALINSASGDLAPLLGQTAATKDFVFTPFSSVANFLTALGFSMNINTLVIDSQTTNGLTVLGTSTFNYAGYDATPGTYSLSFQTAGQGGVSLYDFTYSANARTTAVPEPASLALLGAGLLGLGLAMRRRRGTPNAA